MKSTEDQPPENEVPGRPSNPVAPTISTNTLDMTTPPTLPLNLSPQAWQALSQIAAGLQSLCAAVLQQQPIESGLQAAPQLYVVRPPSPGPALTPGRSAVEPYTVTQTISDFLRAKARAGRSDRYLRQLRVSLGKFRDGRALVPVAAVTIGDVEEWLYAQNWRPKTKRGYLKDVVTLLNFAKRRGLVAQNVADAVELPVLEDNAPEIHTPEQVAKVLEAARGEDPNLCRCLAIKYFAGLRTSEATALAEHEIKTEQGLIEVAAHKAKTRSRRLVTIQPNLRAWLDLGGKLPLTCVNNRMRYFSAAIRKDHQIETPHNVARHSFISYHLEQFANAGKTAKEAGNSEAMVYAHYRALVTPTAAAAYWQIRPA